MFSYFSICTENGIFVLLSFFVWVFSVILEVNGNNSIFKSALISDNTFESVYFALCSVTRESVLQGSSKHKAMSTVQSTYH